MKSNPEGDVTTLLRSWSEGEPGAEEHLWPRVLADLKRLARRHLANQRKDHTLQSGALLNEVYLRLSQLKNAQWESRAGFFALCAEMMRRILIDHARSRQAQKRGGSAMRVPLDGIELMSEPRADELIALDDALKQLETLYPRKSRVVELKFFGGLSFEEIAEALDVSRLTVMRDWDFARAWLQAVLNGDPIDDC